MKMKTSFTYQFDLVLTSMEGHLDLTPYSEAIANKDKLISGIVRKAVFDAYYSDLAKRCTLMHCALEIMALRLLGERNKRSKL